MLDKAIPLGLTGKELLRVITGIGKACASRSAVTTGCGAALGAAATGVGTAAVSAIASTSLAAAPVIVPLAVATGAVSRLRNLFRRVYSDALITTSGISDAGGVSRQPFRNLMN